MNRIQNKLPNENHQTLFELWTYLYEWKTKILMSLPTVPEDPDVPDVPFVVPEVPDVP